MKRIAFLFTQGPHGSAAGREGLDAVLATSAFCEQIGLFFLSDGVFQLLPQQQPQQILARDYIATFGVLPLYDVDACYLCETSLQERGLQQQDEWVLPVQRLTAAALRERLASYDITLTF